MLERITFADAVCTPLEQTLTDYVGILGAHTSLGAAPKKGPYPSNSYGFFVAGRKMKGGRKQENTVT